MYAELDDVTNAFGIYKTYTYIQVGIPVRYRTEKLFPVLSAKLYKSDYDRSQAGKQQYAQETRKGQHALESNTKGCVGT